MRGMDKESPRTVPQVERRLLSLQQLKDLTGYSEPTLWRLRQRSDFPSAVRGCTRPRFWADEIYRWLDGQKASAKKHAPTAA